MIEALVGDFPDVRAVETQSDRFFREEVYANIQLWCVVFHWHSLCIVTFTDYVVSGQLQVELSQPHDSAMNT